MSEGDHSLSRGRPRFSIISAVYNVSRYLDDFIASVEAQTHPLDDVEVIMVDDGSTDDSRSRLESWARSRPGLVTVLTKENGGQATARNLGLQHAHGEWVTFTDPDDRIQPEYLAKAAKFADRHPDVEMMASRRLMLNDETGEVTDTHPLRRHFTEGNRLRDLRVQGEHFHGSAPAAFFRRERIEAIDLRFDTRVRPNFEDGHFCGRYLLHCPAPLVGYLRSSVYEYRKRSDGTSTLQRGLSDRRRYTDVLRYGYLALLRESTAEGGQAPEWLQSQIIYDLTWYFSTQEHVLGLAGAATGEVAEEFHELLGEICGLLEPDVLNRASTRRLQRRWRDILLHAYQNRTWHADEAIVTDVDTVRRLVRVSYHFIGDPPVEHVLCGGKVADPEYAKIRDIAYHGRVLLHERVLWFSSERSVRIQLDGRDVPIYTTAPVPGPRTLRPGAIRRYVDERTGEVRRPERPKRTLGARLTLALARSRPVRRLFADAWVVMDRVHDADDNGERLFRYLRKARRRINAWFVIEKGTPDWQRLRRDGYKRVVPFGSLRWRLLMLNCSQLVSSHADQAVIDPPDLKPLVPRPTWRFSFLQHGVIKDDLSVWLNSKPIEVFVTSTQQEYESVAGDHTTYTFTGKETVLTGLPRFDRLLEVGSRFPVDQRDLVLVVPTWRQWLIDPLEKGSQRRTARAEFFESDFIRAWMGVLRSPELREACERHGVRVGFLPHPNLQPVLPELDLPDHVVALTYAGNDVQEYFARAAVMVTDYSSVAFNAAYIDRPVVYFQFDAERMFGGEHVGQGGYFHYDRDGFGPVTGDLDEAVAATVAALDRGKVPERCYAERIERTFVLRDGNCCKRVTDAIVASGRPHRPSPGRVQGVPVPDDVDDTEDPRSPEESLLDSLGADADPDAEASVVLESGSRDGR